MTKLPIDKEATYKEPIDDLVIYNDEQRWWANIKDNSEATIKQFKDSLKLQKEILLMAESKIKELA